MHPVATALSPYWESGMKNSADYQGFPCPACGGRTRTKATRKGGKAGIRTVMRYRECELCGSRLKTHELCEGTLISFLSAAKKITEFKQRLRKFIGTEEASTEQKPETPSEAIRETILVKWSQDS